MVQIVMTPPKATLRGMDVMQTTANSMMEERDTPHLAGSCTDGGT